MFILCARYVKSNIILYRTAAREGPLNLFARTGRYNTLEYIITQVPGAPCSEVNS